MELRGYQVAVADGIKARWASGARNVMGVLATGAGKTVISAHLLRGNVGPCCAIAHRQELVGQISVALAREGLHHRIIGPQNIIKFIVSQHVAETGRSYYNASASCAVAGVDTLVRRQDALRSWANSVTMWFQDEGHHILKANKWGKAAAMFPNARGFGMTATPLRADGKGLSRETDGLMDCMVGGPTMRELIEQGFLTDYRIFAPPSDVDLTEVSVSSATGDYTMPGLRKAVRKSHIIGDVVEHYKRLAMGKLGITFDTDVATASDIAARYRENGVAAEVVSAKTPDKIRTDVLARFRNRELLQLVNVDLFGEGFDLPALEVVSMARPTESFSLFSQQFGRALRPVPGKTHAIIIDHVGNVVRHGLPDADRVWTLAPRDKRSKGDSDAIPLTTCQQCLSVYERVKPRCPYCDFKSIPADRSSPESVDGDLQELDAATLAEMRKAIDDVDVDKELYRAQLMAKRVPVIGQRGLVNKHVRNQEAQSDLRHAISMWGGWQRSVGAEDSVSYRKFYHTYGIDVLSAQALKAVEATELTTRLNIQLKGIPA